MLSWLVRLLVYRFAGARVLLALSVLGWLRDRLGSRRQQDAMPPDTEAAPEYAPPP